ncbi:hypothetical protein ACFQ4L_00880 [Lapidilactobacillus mulanensis]|uniref:Uncharacterized protein n=1 Tax=Lapidilactobacillus mulanensis TaxID=2485999 RepID=A0ABW4DMR6_9LACO
MPVKENYRKDLMIAMVRRMSSPKKYSSMINPMMKAFRTQSKISQHSS